MSDLITISPEVDRMRETFLRMIFDGGDGGYFCIAYNVKERDPKKFRQEFFRFPDEIPDALELINSIYQSHHIWYSPMLFSRRERKKEYVTYTPNAWADLDTCEPEKMLVKPTFTIESSPGRYQAIWMFDYPLDPDEAQNISQRIAYHHGDDGCDRSGWDLTQLLRMPATYNLKYATVPAIRIIEANRKRYRESDFAEYPSVESFMHVDIPMPDLSDIPDPDDILERERLKMSPTVWRLYQEPLDPGASWSEPLWKLMMYLFEAGFEANWVFAVARASTCNKWEKAGAGDAMLWKDVVRAQEQYARRRDPTSAPPEDHRVDPLVTDEERAAALAEDSFVERYITWAKSLGDAAPQYHQAGAFIALSALLAGSVQLPTSFGVIKPNLWFMILADTTLTRKSTAMDIAMDMVMEIDNDVVMATDGSLEGLLTGLQGRTSMPSVFLRDEFSGLLEQMTKKDYMAGMPELLTKLYDGKFQKRMLRKEVVEVKDPCLLVFAGGIKNKVTSLLSFEHVSSGFMPRFVFITAESDITRVKPLGPPTTWTDDNRAAIQNELLDLYQYYNRIDHSVVAGTNISIQEKHKFNAELTPEAWSRYNRIEEQMLQSGIEHSRPEIMTPVFDRLSKSILKAAVLLAASRKRSDPVVVEERDVVRAAVYGENWRSYVIEVMDNVGKGHSERLYDNILRAAKKRSSLTRSTIMQNFHLDARQTTQVLETMEQRGLIIRVKNGNSETISAVVTPSNKEKV